MACEDYVIIQTDSNKYKDLFLDPLPEVPDYVPAPLPVKSLPLSKSMPDFGETRKIKTHYPSPLSQMAYAPADKLNQGVELESDSSDEEVDPRLYANPPPPLKLHKNLPIQRVY